MEFFKYENTDNNIVSKLNDLHKKCCDFDGISHPFYACDEEECGIAYVYMDAENTICAALTVYFTDESECHIYALTHPDFRRNGYFTSLLQNFKKDALNLKISNISIPVHPDNVNGKNIALSMPGISFDHTEFILKYNSDSKPERKPYSSKVSLSVDKYENFSICYCILNNNLIGSCKIDFSCGCATIFEFEIYECFRSKGYGSSFLQMVTTYILKREKNILLQVSGANTPAYKMYLHHGFKVYSSIDYLLYSTEF